jgi:hypothetical protein
MGFKYACFISYCHGQNDLVRTFIDQLESAINTYLDTYLDEKVYVDRRRLMPGERYDEALAQAICESLCMIVVYTPRYERHGYCLREFDAMRRLEEQRRALLGKDAGTRGMIIPIVFKSGETLPEQIKSPYQYVDFSKFTLASIDMSRNPDFLEEIQRVCRAIYAHFEAFNERNLFEAAFAQCPVFKLSDDASVPPWRQARQPCGLPLREVPS